MYDDIVMAGDIALRVIGFARELIGVPYALYLNPRIKQQPADGLSCFALVCHAYESAGVGLPPELRRVRDVVRFEVGQKVTTIDALIPADIIVLRGLRTSPQEGPTHCALYAGDSSVVHSSLSAGQVSEEPLERVLERYQFMGARRIL